MDLQDGGVARWGNKAKNQQSVSIYKHIFSELPGPVLHVDPAGDLHEPAPLGEESGQLVHHQPPLLCVDLHNSPDHR